MEFTAGEVAECGLRNRRETRTPCDSTRRDVSSSAMSSAALWIRAASTRRRARTSRAARRLAPNFLAVTARTVQPPAFSRGAVASRRAAIGTHAQSAGLPDSGLTWRCCSAPLTVHAVLCAELECRSVLRSSASRFSGQREQ